MQTELAESHPELRIQLLGVNEWGLDHGNARATTGRDIPYLQDDDTDGDSLSDAWTSWEVEWRDVVVVDAEGEVVSVYNLTVNNLAVEENYDELKQILIDASEPVVALPGDCNADGAIDALDLSCVATLDERDLVLGELNTIAGDLDGDGEVGFKDFLVLSTNFGQEVSSYTEGNVDLNDGVDFGDFLVLSRNFGQTAASATDEVFAELEA